MVLSPVVVGDVEDAALVNVTTELGGESVLGL